jgi:hypothetical protein
VRGGYIPGGGAFKDRQEDRCYPAACQDPDHFLLTSLALVLNRIMNNKEVKTNNIMFINDTLEEVHPEIKERYRANLPVLIKMINTQIAKAEHYKKFTQGMSFDTHDMDNAGNKGVRGTNLGLFKFLDNGDTYFSKLLDNMTRFLYDMKSSLEGVYKELNDRPKFFEMYSNYIEEYRRINNSLPLMLPSMSTFYLGNCHEFFRKEDSEHLGLFPSIRNGTDVFKFLYGTRGFLNTYKNNITVEDIPFIKELVEMYNSATTNRESINVEFYLQFLNKMRPLLQYCYDTMYYRNRLISNDECYEGVICNTIHHYPSRDNKYLIAKNEIRIPDNVHTYASESSITSANLNKVLFSVESIHRNEKIKEIVDHVVGPKFSGGSLIDQRKENIAKNILELGVSPINIYAIMREIPLSFIYNYAYTADDYFDRVIDMPKLLKTSKQGTVGTRATPPDFNYQNIFRQFLRDPYCECDDEDVMIRALAGKFGLCDAEDRFIRPQLIEKSLNDITNINKHHKNRFNTTFIRNILAIVVIHRVLRHSLHNELLWHQEIASEHEIINPDITDNMLIDG